MLDYVVAGASSIEDIPQFMETATHAGISVLLVENAAMLSQVPEHHRHLITCK